MNTPRWKTSLFAAARAGSRSPARSVLQATTGFTPDADTTRAVEIKLDDIPVFDRHRRQVGSILGADYTTENVDARAAGSAGQNSRDLLSHGMNATISWLTEEPLAVVIDQLMHAPCLRRIPLMDSKNWLCGIVVFAADERRSPSLRDTSDTVRTAPTSQRR